MASKTWVNGSGAAWRKVRLLVLRRDGWRCQLKLEGCAVRAKQVHHTRPRALVGDDPAWLVAACQPCNNKVGDPTTTDPDPKPCSWLKNASPTKSAGFFKVSGVPEHSGFRGNMPLGLSGDDFEQSDSIPANNGEVA